MKIKSFVLAISSLVILSGNAFASNLSSGIDLFKSGQYDRAIEALNKAVKEEPDNPEPHLWLSKCYEETLQLDKTFPEKKLYNDLKYKQNLKPKSDESKTDEKVDQNVTNSIPDIEQDSNKLLRLNDSYLREIISKRKTSDQVRNLKFIEYNTIKKWLSDLPSDSESLMQLNSDYKLKVRSGIANQQEMILLNKSNADLIELEIETKKFDRDSETDPEAKKVKSEELTRLIREHNNLITETVNLINQPVYENTDPTSYDYFVASEITDTDAYIKGLEAKKSDLILSINDVSTVITQLKKSIPVDQKALNNKVIDKKLLAVDISTLSPNDKELVTGYNTLNQLVISSKSKLLSFIKEQNILISAYKNINNTIKKINPKYVFKDPVLPKEEILQVMPDEQPQDIKKDIKTEDKK